jgi:diguanylate cyclase (GGDEF)-like protein
MSANVSPAARSWEDEFRELAEEFLRSGSERLCQLDEAVRALTASPGDVRPLQELRRHFHRLVGAGATYGFPELSDVARAGEDLCLRAESGGELVCRALLPEWIALVARLRDGFATAGRAPSGADGSPPGAVSSPEAPESGHRPPYNILVIDSDPSVRAVLQRLLVQEGMVVRLAATGAAARESFDEALPDGLIVDIDLADGKGYGVVEDLRARPGGDVPAVLIFSLTNEFLDQTDAVHAGADACFEKPLDWEVLVRKLYHLLERTSVQAPRILLVEDDPDHSAFVRASLGSAGYDVRVCDAPRQFKEVLASFRPDLLLMDIVLPDVSGYDLARYVRQDDQYVTLPIVFLTGEAQVQARIQTVKAGGDDHLVKPVHPSLLVSSVAARLERARFLKTLLNRDGLTRLLTHTSFMEHAQGVVAQKQRHEPEPAALVMIDIDHFKTINDTFGHQAGDRVLVALSGLLRRHLRRSDIIGRYGGEEFGVLLDRLFEDEAVRLMQRLLLEFAEVEQRAPGGQTFRVTFSAGVAMLDPATMDLERWIQAADTALYAAKRAGRNRVFTHTEWLGSLRPQAAAGV